MTAFPLTILPVKVELLINGVWQDITHYVLTRSDQTPITITGGQSDQSGTVQPGVCTMTLNNTDGRFSPNYASGAYFPFLQRNTQLRVSLVNVTSITSNVYNGYRFWGEVSSWPPLSDLTGSDIFVQITASGPLRRVNKGGGKGSALTRYYDSLTGANAPIAYWPCEDDPNTNSIGTALQGGLNMTVTGTPKWAADSNFDGSLPVLILNKATLTGNTGSVAATTTNVVRFVMTVPSFGGQDLGCLLKFTTNGTVAQVNVYYRKGGKLQIRGYNSGGANTFDSGQIATVADGQPLMVSVELTTSGSNVAWALRTIKPGAAALNSSATGSLVGSVSYVKTVTADPSANVVSTSIGHISVQNALISLTSVSQILNGSTSELGIDRFIRLCNEQALAAEPEYNEKADHWGFEDGTTQSWIVSNGTGTLANDTVFHSDGTHSLKVTSSAIGTLLAASPTGTSGQPILPGDIVSAAAEIYNQGTPTMAHAGIEIAFYNAAGSYLSSAYDTGGFANYPSLTTGQSYTAKSKGAAPATAAFCQIKAGDYDAAASASLVFNVDNVRLHPRMGPQTAKELAEFLKEIKELDQGILKEAKDVWGLKYKTRISMINQTPALTLSYSAAHLAAPLAAVHDDLLTKNHIVVHRHKGGKVEIVQTSGASSVQEPPNGIGRYKKIIKLAAEDDAQLYAYATHLLALGTDLNERYPTVEVNMARPEVANLFSAIGGMEAGEYLQITNLPFWYPNSTAKQLVIGYTETLSNYTWDIVWNCQPENPLEIVSTSLRRW